LRIGGAAVTLSGGPPGGIAPILARAGVFQPGNQVRAMETPQVRPGRVTPSPAMPRVVAFFYNTAQGNSAIQLLTALGVPNDRLGVTPPEQIEGGQGMVLSIPCPDEALVLKVEALCRSQGAAIHRQKR
jgi:hypothetical protein